MGVRRGDGSVFKWRGKWAADVIVGHRPDGKPVRKRITGERQTDVLADLRKTHKGLDPGRVIDRKVTLEVFGRRWLATMSERIQATTWVRYEGVLRMHVFPTIGHKVLAQLTARDIRALDEAAKTAGASPSTRLHMHAILRKLLNDAVRAEEIQASPMAAIQGPKVKREKMRPLSVADAKALEKASKGDRLHALYVLALRTGMRLGELLGLQWGDVDTTTRAVYVQRALRELHGEHSLVETKTHTGRRIELDGRAMAVLKAHRKAMKAEGYAGEFVFVDNVGSPIRKSNMTRRSFKPLLRAAGIDEAVRFHDLRHTHATLALQAGVNPKVVQERLGHAKIELTLNTYSHVIPSMQREAASMVAALLDG